MQGNIAIGNEALTLAGGSLNSGTGNNSWAGDIVLDVTRARTSAGTVTLGTASATSAINALRGNFRVTGNIRLSDPASAGAAARAHTLQVSTAPAFGRTPASAVTLGGNISGADGGLTKAGAGDLRLTGTNTYTGPTTINGGSITLTGNNDIPTASRLIINNGGTLAMGDYNQTLRGLRLNDGNITANARLAAAGAAERGVLTVTPRAGTETATEGLGEFDVRKGRIEAILRGTNINLVKRSDGTTTGADIGGAVRLSFTGAHPLTGDLTIEAGRLIIDGVTAGGGALTVRGGDYDLRGRVRTWASVTLVSGSISDSGREVADGSGGTRLEYGALTVSGAGTFNLQSGAVSAKLSGAGALAKNAATGDNPNTVTLGNANNDYSGQTTVNNGTLAITGAGALGAGAITVNSGGVLALSSDPAGAGFTLSRALSLAGGALGNVRGNNSYNGNLSFTAAGGIQSAAGRLTVSSALRLQTAAGAAWNLTVKGAGDVVLSGLISGAGGLIKGESGAAGAGDTGRLTLSGANTYAGATAVNHGVLRIQNAGALGAATSAATDDTTVAGGGTLELDPATGNLALDANEGLSLAGQGALGDPTNPASARLGALRSVRGANTVRANITLTGDAAIYSAAGAANSLTLPGVISHAAGAAFGFSKTGAGRLTLSAANTYTGATIVNSGTLAIRHNSALGTTAGGTTVNRPATLELDGDGLNVGEALTLSGGRLANPSGNNTWSGAIRIINVPGVAPGLVVGSGLVSRTAGDTLTLTGNINTGAGTGLGERMLLGMGGAGNITINTGVISGTGNIYKDDPGVLELGGNNTFTGRLEVDGGTLRVTHNNALGTNAGYTYLRNNATLELQAASATGSLTIGDTLWLGANITLRNLRGTNTLSGRIRYISAGMTLTIDNQQAPAAGVTTPTLSLSGNFSRLVSDATLNLSVRGAGNTRLSGSLNLQGGNLIKQGAGRLTLAGNGAGVGAVRLTAGILRLEGGNALNDNAAVNLNTALTGNTARLEIAGAVDETIGALSGRGTVVIGAGRRLTINSGADDDTTYNGVISGATAAGLSKTGAGTLTLSGGNTYAGTTLVNGGTLAVTASGALGAGAVTVNSGGVLALSSDPGGTGLDLSRALTLNGGALGNVRGNNTYSGALTLTADSIIRSTSGTLTVSGDLKLQTDAEAPETTPTPHDLSVAGAGDVLLSGVISGAGDLIKGNAAADSGRLTLSGVNTYTGATIVNHGTLAIRHNSALGTTAGGTTVNRRATLELDGNGLSVGDALTLNSGTLDNPSGNNTWSGAISVSTPAVGGVVVFATLSSGTAGDTLTITGNINTGAATATNLLRASGAGNVTINTGVISGTGDIFKYDAGVLELGGNNTAYTGDLNIYGGTLRVTHNNALGTTTAGVRFRNTTTLELRAASATGSLTISDSLLLWFGANATLRNARGINTLSGQINVGARATLTIDNQQTPATGVTTPTLTLSGPISSSRFLGGGRPFNFTVLGAGNTRLSGALNQRGGELIKQGAGRLTLAGAGAGVGAVRLTAGTLRLEGGNALNDNAAVNLNTALTGNTARLEIAGAADETIGALSGRGTVAIGAGRRLTINSGADDDTTYNGVISGATAAGLAKTGAGTLTLSGANTYAGTTLVNGGTLAITASGALGAGAVTVNSGGVLALSSDPGGTGLDLSRPLTLAGGALGNVRGDNTYSGALTFSADSIIQSTSGTLTVSGPQSLQTAATSPATTPAGRNLTVKGAGNVVLSGLISGAGGLIKGNATADSGLLTLSAANTYAGTTLVNGGTLRINDPDALGDTSSGTTINRGGILESVLTNPSRTILINAGEALTLNGGILRLRREYRDSSARTFSNSITLGADSVIEHIYVGPTGTASSTCAAGAVCDRTTTLSGNLSLQSASGTTTTGHTLTIRTRKTGRLVGNFISRVVLSGNISGAGGLSKEGEGDLRLSGTTRNYTGPTTISGGSLTLTRNNAISTASRLIINNGATLAMGDYNQTLRGLRLNDGNITANARLAVTGPPALTERGVLTVTPLGEGETAVDGLGEFDVRKGAIAAILRGTNINLIKRSDGTTTGGDIGGTVRLSFTGAHPLTGGDVTIEAGRLIIDGTLSGGVLTVRGTYDLRGVNRNWTGVRLVSGSIIDSGREVTAADGTRSTAYGALTVSGQFNLESGLVSARLSGAGALNKNAATGTHPNTVTLSNAGNDYTGLTTVNNGTLAITRAGALGAGAITVNSGGALALNPATGSNLSLSRGLTLAGGALANLSGNNAWSGNLSLTAGSRIRAVAGTALTLSGVISHATTSSFGLSKEGAGRLILTGVNTYTGATAIDAGELELDNSAGNALHDSSAVTLANVAGARLTVTNGETIASLAGGGEVAIASAQRLTINQATNTTYSGVISGAGGTNGGLSKTGAGALTLSGANTYAGTTNINAGKLIIAHSDAADATTPGNSSALGAAGAGNGTIIGSNGVLELQGDITRNAAGEITDYKSEITLAEDLTLNGGTLRNLHGTYTLTGGVTLGADSVIDSARDNTARTFRLPEIDMPLPSVGLPGSLTLSGVISSGSGNYGLSKIGLGDLTLSGANTYRGRTIVAQGRLTVGGNSALGATTGANSGAIVYNNASLVLQGGAGANITIGAEALTLAGGRLESISGNNRWNGAISLDVTRVRNADGSVTTGAAGATSAINALLGNLRLAGAISLSSGAGAAARAHTLEISSLTAAAAVTISGNISGAGGNLIKLGLGRLTLNGTSSYTGVTDIRQGTLAIGRSNAINAGSRLIVGQLRSGSGASATDPVEGVFAMGAFNQTFSGVRLNAGSITASPVAPTTAGAASTGRGVLTVTPARGATGGADGVGEFDVRAGEIQAILNGPANLIKRTDGTTLATQTASGNAEDIGGVVRLSYTGDHLFEGATRILAGRLVVLGGKPNSILVVENITHDLKGRDESYRGVRLLSGRIVDTGRTETGTTGRITGSLTVNGGGSGLSAGQFDLRSGTVSAKLAGSGDLVKNAAGAGLDNRVILSGNNAYRGQTIINSGILRIQHANALGTPELAISGGDLPTTNTTVNRGGTLQLAGGIIVPTTESLTLNGGLLHGLNGANTWAGNINLTLASRILAQSALSAAGAAAPDGTTLNLGGVITLNTHTLTLDAAGAETTGDGAAITRRAASAITVQRPTATANAITGSGGLTKQGTGLVTLASQNTYTGETRINAGELRLTNTSGRALPGAVLIGNARLAVTENNTIGSLNSGVAATCTGSVCGDIRITKGKSLTIDQALGADGFYYGSISEIGATGRANLIKTGAGRLKLNAASTYTGATTINNGALVITHSDALGTGTDEDGRVTVNAGGTLELEGPATGAGLSLGKLLTLNGRGFNTGTAAAPVTRGALLNATGANTWSGAITLAGDTTINNLSNTGTGNTLTLGGGISGATFTLTVAGRGNTLISGVIGATTGGLSKTGTGTLTLGATNTYTGLTRVEDGTLKLGGDNAINSGGSLVVAGGIFDLAGYDNTFSGVQLLSGTMTDSGRTVSVTVSTSTSVTGKLTLNNDGTADSGRRYFDLREGTVSAGLAGTAGLRKTGAGKVTLTSANSYTGATFIDAGTLSIGDNHALGFDDSDTASTTATTVAADATLELDPGAGETLTINNEDLTLNGQGVLDGGVRQGALRNLSGTNTWSGAIRLASNATIHNANTTGTAPTLILSGALSLQSAAATPVAASLTLTGAGKTRITGRITGLGGLIKQGAGTLVVNNSSSANPNNYQGGTEIREGELELQGGEASPDDGAAGRGVTLSRGATLRVTNSETIGSLRDNSADTTPGGNVVLGGFRALTVNNGSRNDTTFSGEISDARGGGGVGSLIKDGEGVFTLAGRNTYTFRTFVRGGTLALGRDNAIAGSNILRIESGGIFDLGAFSNAFTSGVQLASGEIRATGADSNRDSNQGKLFVNNPGGSFSLLSGTVEAKLAGTAKISKTTTGTVRLRGLNSYTGITEISKGILALEGSDAVLPTNTRLEVGTARVTDLDATDATLDLGTTNATVAHVLLRGGNIIRAAGATDNQGVLTVNPVAAGDKIDLRRGTISAILAGNANLEKDSVTITELVFGRSPVTATRQGVVTLSGPNRYTGTTTINAGNLILTGGAALPDNSAVALATAASAKLTVRQSETIGSLSGGSATGGGIDIAKGHTLTVNQTTDGVYNGVISEFSSGTERASFTKTGAAKLTLGGLNLYTGLTTINAGTLAIANNGALGSGAGSLGAVVNTGGVLELAGSAAGLNVEDEELELNSGTLRNAAGEGDADNTWGGAITLRANSTIDGTGGLTLAGTIDGTTAGQQDLTLADSLTARFNGAVGGGVALRDFTVAGATQVILNANLTATRRVTFSNITGAAAVNQTAGALRAPELLLQNNAGSVNLADAGNDITTLAAANPGAQLNYTDRNGFTIGTVGEVSGITANNTGLSLAAGLAEAGALNIGADIRADSGEVRLTNRNGDINTTRGIVATSSRLTITASGGVGVNGAFRTEFTGTEAGSLSITTRGAAAAGNINLVDPRLNTRVLAFQTDPGSVQTVRLSTRHSGESRNPGTTTSGESRTPILSGTPIVVNNTTAGATNLDANDTLIFDGPTTINSDINTNNPAFTFNGPVTTNANRRINTGRGALTFRSTINAGANTLALTSNRLTLFDDITASALDMSGATELVISGNSPTLNVNPVNIRFPNTMTGRGALTIPGMSGQSLDVGAAPGTGLRLPANMRGYRGHMIIGGDITPEGMAPFYSGSVSNIRINVPSLTISRPIETGGPLTLLAGDINLNANIRTGGELGILAVGPSVPGLSGSRGVIDASAGRVSLSVPPGSVDPARPSAALVAARGFIDPSNITLALARRELDVASGQGAIGFNLASRFTDNATNPAFRAFIARLGLALGARASLGLQFAQTFSFNPAAGLVAIETLAFVDLSLFGEELTLFGTIGAGIALALSQCEEQDGCAPNVTLEELDTLVEQIEARVAELERRRAEAGDSSDQTSIDQQLAEYREELQNFEDYREELKKYILAEEEDFGDGLGALPGAAGDSDEVARLTRVLQSVLARVRWLEGLKTNPTERQRLGRATGAELTLERLEAIIEAARAQAGFIENRIRLLLEGAEAMLPMKPDFKAEAGDYEGIDVVQYGDPSFGIGALTVARGLY